MEWIKVIVPLVLSWPVMAFVVVLIFRKPILALLSRFGSGSGSEAELGLVLRYDKRGEIWENCTWH